MLERTGAIIDDHDGRFFFHPAPDREPDFIAGLVVLGLNDSLRSGPQISPLGDRQYLESGIQIIDVEHRHRLTDGFIRMERGVHPQVGRFRVGLDEQRAATLAIEDINHLEGLFRMVVGIGSDQGDVIIAQCAGAPHRSELGVDEIRATAGVRDALDGISASSWRSWASSHGNPVGFVGGRQEIAPRSIQPPSCRNGAAPILVTHQVVNIFIVDQQIWPVSFDVYDELGMLMRTNIAATRGSG